LPRSAATPIPYVMSRIPHPFPFDPTYGYSREQLLAIAHADSEPSGFADFWRGLRAKSGEVPPEITTEEQPSPDPAFRLLKVFYTVHPVNRSMAFSGRSNR